MCDFKPGDEVVCVDDAPRRHFITDQMPITKGRVYVVTNVVLDDLWNEHGVVLQGIDSGGYMGAFIADRFRKVQRRDLSAWLKTSVGNTDKLDKRQKVKA